MHKWQTYITHTSQIRRRQRYAPLLTLLAKAFFDRHEMWLRMELTGEHFARYIELAGSIEDDSPADKSLRDSLREHRY